MPSDRPAEVFDPRAMAAKRAEQAAAAAAAEAAQMAAMPAPVQQAAMAAQRPQIDPLERALTALHTGTMVRPTLPPTAIARRYDPRLASMLEESERLHRVQMQTANEWATHRPGTKFFAQEVDQAADEAEIAELLINGQAVRWAEAVMAERRALAHDETIRDFGRTSETLRQHLEAQAAELRAEMVRLLRLCIAEKRTRYRDQATEVRTEWQTLRALQRWCADPRKGWVPLHPAEAPDDVVPVWLRTMEALGEELPPPTREGSFVVGPNGIELISGELPAGPSRPNRLGEGGTFVNGEPTKRGLFRKGR